MLPPADALVLRAAVAAYFEPTRLGALALDTFSERLDAGYAPAVLGWLERPQTQDLLTRATAGAATSSEPGRAGSRDEVRARDALLLRFERRGGHAGRAQRHAALVFRAMLRSANPLLPPLQRYSASEVDRLWSNPAKAAAVLGWVPAYAGREGLRRGLAQTVAWFTQQQNLAVYKPDIYNL